MCELKRPARCGRLTIVSLHGWLIFLVSFFLRAIQSNLSNPQKAISSINLQAGRQQMKVERRGEKKVNVTALARPSFLSGNI